MQQKITDALDTFSQTALCTWLNSPGASNAVSALAIGAVAVPDPITTAAGLGLLATQMGCAFDSGPAPGTGTWEGEWVNTCECENVEGYNRIYLYGNVGGNDGWYYWTDANVKEFELEFDQIGENTWTAKFRFKYCGNTSDNWDGELTRGTNRPYAEMRQEGDMTADCLGPPEKPPSAPPLEPITGDSPELGCTLQADLGGWIVGQNGQVTPVIKYKTITDGTRASGGVVSGCNWYGDLIYVGGGGGQPPRVTPFPPDEPWPIEGPGVPDWLQDIFSDLGANVLYDLLQQLFEQPIEGITYEMVAPCDVDDKGKPLVWTKKIPPAPWLDALGYRITALNEQMSQHLAWKTPICNEQPEIEGNWRTISFRSESTSPYGNSRLRKRFRYRSTNSLDLGEIVDYWKDFTFQSGSVVVGHVGSSWGSPQVWAATEDEGKRVIRHAAGEAGIDPDQVGRWAIGSSSSSRFGVSDTMKVDTTGGYYWITSRDGSDNRPVVAKTSDL